MGAVLELLEVVVDFFGSWRLYVCVVPALLLAWLVLEFGPAGLVTQVIAGAIVLAGFVVGWRWDKAVA